jgi:hypothetical protein
VVRVGGRSRRRGPAAVQEALFDVVVRPERRYYRQILDVLARSGFGAGQLDSEQVVSKILGTVWAGQPERDGELEETFGLGLADYAGQRHNPVALALLRTLAVVAPIREVRTAAATAGDRLAAGGVPEPGWDPPVGRPGLGRCWAFEDVFGDQSTVVCEFAYAPDAGHATVIAVDHARSGVATDTLLSTDVESALRDLTTDAQNSGGLLVLRQEDPAWARALLGRAFARTDLIAGTMVEPAFADFRALALARLDLLPEDPLALPLPGPRPDPAALTAEFLDDTPSDLWPDPGTVVTVARAIADFTVHHEPATPYRVGPAKWEAFDDWLRSRPTGALAGSAVVAGSALPAVVRAWSSWAGGRSHLPAPALAELSAALDELFPTVTGRSELA